ncbi:hypothetical protein E4P42_20885 [Mycobacterium sp. PS03-16]|uniref:maleylpyruvate isomerase N-terminal domain-containing protein n=1 Tax=Mycobacterium sp. PS03-16 TaxID=2559611 RepID=UPI001074240D|nr:maleylpyruvate isomerase N-terminal domain-containing protein [Mycobacterium sp. PS03-16]TFV56050.1 hypothetical protein E4P42_20885 [Mycobacterium sp. PS03-16]
MGCGPFTPRTVLADAWDRWSRRCAELTADEWSTPTRCDGWDVAALVAHVCPGDSLFDQLSGAAIAGPAAVTDPADLLRTFNAPEGAAQTMAGDVAAGALAEARGLTPSLAAARFAVNAERLRAHPVDPDTVIAYPVVGSATLAVVTEVALMEATVHLLDLAAAVGGVEPSDEALSATRALLIAVPEPVAAVEALAGRVPARAAVPAIR